MCARPPMHRLVCFARAIAALLAVAPAFAQAEWTPLFDGESLAGWHVIGEGSFTVEDGVIVATHAKEQAPYGHLVSDGRYADFALRVRFRTTRGNSGLYFRVAEEGFSGVTGFQAEIDPNAKTGGLYETNGRGWVVAPSDELLQRRFRVGDWNTMVVSARGTRLRVAVNGLLTADLDDEQGRREGHIALQVHGGQDVKVEFASVELLADPARDPLLTPADDARFAGAVTLDGFFPFEPPGTLEAWKERRERVRRQILVAAGLWPMIGAPPSTPVIHGRVDRGDHTVEKVFFESFPGHFVTGNLYRPAGEHDARRPAVLSPHGHHADGRFLWTTDGHVEAELESGAEEHAGAARSVLQARCAHLARMGCVVFHYDMVGYADSQQVSHRDGFKDVTALMQLQSAFGLQTFNSLRAFDFLASLPDVDPNRIAVTGASGGGTQTMILCAIDDRPVAGFPAVMVSTAMQGGCVCENAPYLRLGSGNVEFAALAAPRPYAMSAANDWTIDIEAKGLPFLKELWGLHGVEELVDARCWPEFGHNYNLPAREMMYRWFDQHLALGGERVAEEPFEPLEPAALSVFDDAHPLPARASDVGALRRWWREASEERMAALAPTDAASLARYRRVVGGALEVMLGTELPASGTVAAAEAYDVVDDTGRVRTVFLNLGRGPDEVVPATLYRPADDADWNGTVVIDVREGGAWWSDANALVLAGAALLAPDELGTESSRGAGLPVDGGRHGTYVGYTYGYNRTLLAQRVHDVLTAIAYARDLPGAERVRLLGTGDAGVWAVLAAALAGDAVERVATELPWDFDEVESFDHPGFLPGAVKYGGVDAFAALLAPRELRVYGGALPAGVRRAYAAAGVRGAAEEATSRTDDALAWLAE